MPKLARLRFVNIGHKNARFDDLLLDFQDTTGAAQTAALWLRNGGGKSTLLTLVFALLLPNARTFLRKNSRLDEYVLPGDCSAVLAEWELTRSGGNTLYSDEAPDHLITGVFYQRDDSSTLDEEGSKIRKLFFAAYSQPGVEGLTIDTIPLYEGAIDEYSRKVERTRRSLRSFKTEWQGIGLKYPHADLKEIDNLTDWNRYLKDVNLNPELFRYQLEMNREEGGAYGLFDLKEADAFTDLFVKMISDDNIATELATALRQQAHKIKAKKVWEQEREMLQELQSLLPKFVDLNTERQETLRRSAEAQAHDQMLARHIAARVLTINAEAEIVRTNERRMQVEIERVQTEETKHRFHAAHLRLKAARILQQERQKQYTGITSKRDEAGKRQAIWRAVPTLRDVQRAEEKVKRYTSERDTKTGGHVASQDERAHAAQAAARSYVAALFARKEGLLVQQEREQDNLRRYEDGARLALQEQFQHEAEMCQLLRESDLLTQRVSDESHARAALKHDGICQEDETPPQAFLRLQSDMQQRQDQLGLLLSRVYGIVEQVRGSCPALLKQIEVWAQSKIDALSAQQGVEKTNKVHKTILENGVIIQLLNTLNLATDILPGETIKLLLRELDDLVKMTLEDVADRTLSIAVSKKAVEHLEEFSLLPTEPEPKKLLGVLRTHDIRSWSGYFMVATNIASSKQEIFVQQHPEVARGVVVDSDYQEAVKLVEKNAIGLTSPVLVCSRAYFDWCKNNNEPSEHQEWQVIGPTSKALYSQDFSSEELSRQKDDLQRQHSELDTARASLRHRYEAHAVLYDFNTRYSNAGLIDSKYQQSVIARENQQESWQKLQEAFGELNQFPEEHTEVMAQLTKHVEGCVETARHLGRVQAYLVSFSDYKGEQIIAILNDLQSRVAKNKEKVAEAERNQRASEVYMKQSVAVLQNHASSIAAVEEASTHVLERASLSHTSILAQAGDTTSLRRAFEECYRDSLQTVAQDAFEARLSEAQNDLKEAQQNYKKILEVSGNNLDAEMVNLFLQSLEDYSDAEFREKDARDEHNILIGEAREIKLLYSQSDKIVLEYEDTYTRISSGLELEEKDHLLREASLEDSASAEELEAKAKLAEHAADHIRTYQTSQLQELLSQARLRKAECEQLVNVLEGQQKQMGTLIDIARPSASLGNDKVSTWLPPQTDSEIETRILERQKELKSTDSKLQHLQKQQDERAQQVRECVNAPRFVLVSQAQSAGLLAAFKTNSSERMAEQAATDLAQLAIRSRHIADEIESIEKSRQLLAKSLLQEAEKAIKRLRVLARESVLPAINHLMQERPFLSIRDDTPPDHNFSERIARIAMLVDDVTRSNDPVPSGMILLQRAVRRLAGQIRISVLFPDSGGNSVDGSPSYVPIEKTGSWSGGEKLTFAILLYCTLAQFRARSGDRVHASGTLILDNPVGTASRARFLTLQREMAQRLGIQLIYATAVDDFEALQTFPVLVRLRNNRYDRRTGHKVVEREQLAPSSHDADSERSNIAAARLILPPRPSVQDEGSTIH